MHPVNAYLSGFVSADFPGAATRYIEQAYGDETIAFHGLARAGIRPS
jgi:hypothetical protein